MYDMLWSGSCYAGSTMLHDMVIIVIIALFDSIYICDVYAKQVPSVRPFCVRP